MQRNSIERLQRIASALGVVCSVGVCGVGANKFLDEADKVAGIDTKGGATIHHPMGIGYPNRVGKRIMLHELHLNFDPSPYHFWLGAGATA